MPVDLLNIPRLKVAGQAVPADVYDSLISFEVDNSLLMPGMFALRLLDQGFKVIDSRTFALGKEIELAIESPAQRGQQSTSVTLIKGEITAIEPEFEDVMNPVTVVRGYDKSHRLYRDRKTRTFVRVKDSDIARQIANEHGLTPDVDQTSSTYDYVCQDNQTDMEFLRGRALHVGHYLHVDGGTMYFVKTPRNDTEVELEWGNNLSEFRARLTAAEQVSKVVVRGWDPLQKQVILGDATAPSQAPTSDGNYGGKVAEQAFGRSRQVVLDSPVWNQSEAKTLAESICEEIGGAFIQAEGTAVGTPGLHAGVRVKLTGIGQRLSGRYRVSRSIHRYGEDGHYETRFEISGRRANTVGDLLTKKSRGAYGVVVGVVTNNNDPENLCRVKVKFANWLNENQTAEIESDWIRMAVPMAGAERGFEFIPEVNDEVLLAFEYDNVQRPFVVGSLWNKSDKPPEGNTSIVGDTGKVQKRIIKSRSGHVIVFDDTENQEKLLIADRTGTNSLGIDSKAKSMAIKADSKIEIQTKGGHKVIIDDQGSSIEVSSGGNSVKINGAQNSISIESVSQLTLKAQQIQIEGTTVSIKGQASMEIEGASTTLKGNAMLTLQGGLVKIN